MTKQQNDFSKGSIPGTILTLAAPMTLAQLINVLYSVVDRMYLGRLPGHLALTGLGLTMPIISILMGFANLCGMGGAPLCSIYRGKGESEEAEYVMGNSFTLLILLGALATLGCLLVKKPMLYLFGASDATFPYADAYLTIYLMGTLFVMISLGLNPFINAQGFAKIGMMSVGLGAVVNIVLDPVFIFALDMGGKGRSAGHHSRPRVLCGVGASLPHRRQGDFAPAPESHAPAPRAGEKDSLPGAGGLLRQPHQQPGSGGMQCHAERLGR